MAIINCGFEGQKDGRRALIYLGPTLWICIGFDPDFRRGVSKPDLSPRKYPALVDTGAQESCIDSGLASMLNLPVVDRREVAGVHGVNEVNYHLAQIYVPTFDITAYGQVAGVHLSSGGQRHLALIGRDFLRNFTLKYEGRTGNVTLSNDQDAVKG